MLRFGATGANGLNVSEETHAVQNDFQSLMEDVFRAGEDRLERVVREQDAILGVHEKHRLLQAAQGGFKLRQLARAGQLQLSDFGDDRVRRRKQAAPIIGRSGRRPVLPDQRFAVDEGAVQAADGLPVSVEPEQGEQQTGSQRGNDQVEHASAFRSAMR